jgi:hypothetical protein
MEKTFQADIDKTRNGGFDSVVRALQKGTDVPVPGWGNLALFSLDRRKTVLFRAADVGRADPFGLGNTVSIPLSEGRTVNIPELGTFRPIAAKDGQTRLSFTISPSLRNSLNNLAPATKDEPAVVKPAPAVQASNVGYSPTTPVSAPLETPTEPVAAPPLPPLRKDEAAQEATPVIPPARPSLRPPVADEASGGQKMSPHTAAPVSPYAPQTPAVTSPMRPATATTAAATPTAERQPATPTKPAIIDRPPVIPTTPQRPQPPTNDPEEEYEELHRHHHSKHYRIIRRVVNVLIILAFLCVLAYIGFSMLKPKDPGLIERPARVRTENRTDLTELAERNYGHRAFWVYIYLANRDKISSPVNIPDGVEITIPNLGEYGVTINDNTDVKRAIDKANELARVIIGGNKN